MSAHADQVAQRTAEERLRDIVAYDPEILDYSRRWRCDDLDAVLGVLDRTRERLAAWERVRWDLEGQIEELRTALAAVAAVDGDRGPRVRHDPHDPEAE